MASDVAERVKQLMALGPGQFAARTIEERRANAELLWSLGATEVEGTTYETALLGGVPGEWARPPGSAERSLLVYLHGGGYTIGSVATHRRLATHLAAASGRTGYLVEYRLAPENPFPAGLDDAVAAFRGLVAAGFEPSEIVLAGDSAGGGLSLATALRLRDEGSPMPGALVLLSPWTDVALTGESIRTKRDLDLVIRLEEGEPGGADYLGGTGVPPTHPLVSPLYADLSGLPPMLVQVGSDEVLLDDSTRLAAKVEAAGGDVTLEVWPEMFHVFQMLAGNMPESDEAVGRIAAWLSSHEERAAAPASADGAGEQ